MQEILDGFTIGGCGLKTYAADIGLSIVIGFTIIELLIVPAVAGKRHNVWATALIAIIGGFVHGFILTYLHCKGVLPHG